MSLNFHTQFNALSQLPVHETDTLDDVLHRLGQKLCECMGIERINIWIFKQNPNRIDCIANYEKKEDHFSKGESLLEEQIPTYFSHLQSDKSIIIDNVYESVICAELKDNYCVDKQIFSIMDIPIRIEGKLAGVICFEQCYTEKKWTDEEHDFALAVSQIVALSIENYKRKHYEEKLKKALEEKSTLLVEMHHRLKNNLSILVSLLRIQSRTIEDQKAINIFGNLENQILSVSKLHEQLYQTGNYLQVELKSYLEELITSIQKSYSQEIKFKLNLEEIELKSSLAVSLGLIINELISNAIKHGSKPDGDLYITVNLKHEKENVIHLQIEDNGAGFDLNDALKKNSFGLGLIYDLSEQIGANVNLSSNSSGTNYEITLPN